jgi:Putative transposase/Transposase zinc-binding domain
MTAMDGTTLNELLCKHREWWPVGLSERQYSVLKEEVFGSMRLACRNCGAEQVIPRSCGNRHCPLCQGAKQLQWCENVCKRLPDVAHFHVVFTLPSEMEEFYRNNFKVATTLFFEAITGTVTQFMRNNWKLEGGFLGVLHTWGQTLCWHPHVHVLVPCGGFDPASGKWVNTRSHYLFSEAALSMVFRAIFLSRLEALEHNKDECEWPEALGSEGQRRRWRVDLSGKKWMIFIRPTLDNTRAAVRYLARYTSRIAISNRRLRTIDEKTGEVEFDYKDYRDHDRIKRMRLKGREFIGRFAMHIAPRRLRRIRYGGILNAASRYRAAMASRTKIGEKAATIPASRCLKCGASKWTMLAIETRLPSRWQHLGNSQHRRLQPPEESRCIRTDNRFPLHTGIDPPLLVQQANAADAGHTTTAFHIHPGTADS